MACTVDSLCRESQAGSVAWNALGAWAVGFSLGPILVGQKIRLA